VLFGKKSDGQEEQARLHVDPKTLELVKQVDKSIVFHFGYPHKVDKQLLERLDEKRIESPSTFSLLLSISKKTR